MAHDSVPQRLSTLLGGIKAFQLIRAWRECAGPALLKQTEFQGIQTDKKGQRVLKLNVPDPLWRQELEYQKNDILRSYCEALRNIGFPESELPVDCSLGAERMMPTKSRHS